MPTCDFFHLLKGPAEGLSTKKKKKKKSLTPPPPSLFILFFSRPNTGWTPFGFFFCCRTSSQRS